MKQALRFDDRLFDPFPLFQDGLNAPGVDIGRCEPSTRRMISNFSDAGYLIRRRPHPRSFFFEQSKFQGLLSDDLFQIAGFSAQLTSIEVAARAVSPARRFFPASRNSLDQL